MKMNRVMAIAEKDFKEFMRNMMLLTMPILPIVMSLIFSKTPLQGEGEKSGNINDCNLFRGSLDWNNDDNDS